MWMFNNERCYNWRRRNCVACLVVTKNVESYTMVTGNPAIVIKNI